MTLSLERRLALLDWARRTGAWIVEDDYDSEYRYTGRPIPALQGLDRSDRVIVLGSFSQVLFTSLRLGYVVLPPALLEPLLAPRFSTDRYGRTLDQAILCDFIEEGHLGRHIRRMRGSTARGWRRSARRPPSICRGWWIPPIEAGLNTAARLVCGLSSRQAETAATAHGVEAMALDRGFDPRRIRVGVLELAAALVSAHGQPLSSVSASTNCMGGVNDAGPNCGARGWATRFGTTAPTISGS
jgi:GntR family transcriptional regulator/MocR family aminotransferase